MVMSAHAVNRAKRTSIKVNGHRKNYLYILLLIILWSVAIGLHFHQWGVVANAASQSKSYSVKYGDTIWSIAVKMSDNQDPRVMVDNIEQLNHLNSSDTVQPGQILIIPDNN